ncbi:MAG: M23 family metallopeptidase, partial [Candidatus Thorarchaeota archaeon]
MCGKLKLISLIFIIINILLLNSCTGKTQEPTTIPTSTKTIIPTDTLEPTSTATVTATVTATPDPIEGRLFFDMNGSGLRDEASFNYASSRLNDTMQPLNPDLQVAVETYIAANPDTQDGDLITIEEPGLSGYEVCAGDECTVTDESGDFVISNPKNNRSIMITISDPNEGNPALEMRYINQWKRAVTVPEYTKDVDVTTMASLEIVPICDKDAEALVCKEDEDTLFVRDQYLNDTSIVPISEEYDLINERVNEIGLMQGFLTLPFMKEQVSKPFILSYFDIIGKRLFGDNFQYYDSLDGVSLTYDGKYNREGVLSTTSLVTGIYDNHTGIDYVKLQRGHLVISGAPTSILFYATSQPQETEIRVHTSFDNPISEDQNSSGYGHLDVRLVDVNQTIYRGQIIGLVGSTNMHPPVPTLHYDFEQMVSAGWKYLDIYRYISANVDSSTENFWGNPVSMWTCE